MKFPNKVTPYRKSVLSKIPLVLNILEKECKTPVELYKKVKNKVENVAEFIQIIDCLFALNKIEIVNGRIFINVERN